MTQRLAALLASFALVAMTTGFLAWTLATRKDSSCAATLSHACAVSFGGRMQEDEFSIDYRSGKLYVKRIIP